MADHELRARSPQAFVQKVRQKALLHWKREGAPLPYGGSGARPEVDFFKYREVRDILSNDPWARCIKTALSGASDEMLLTACAWDGASVEAIPGTGRFALKSDCHALTIGRNTLLELATVAAIHLEVSASSPS